ncbi:hypothetical protein MPH_01689 [Macrophomina phaseolina MS6]|uniref:Uncharacterized protein n=1 Tax=Macrophomina phaseolina (strain MS6) TaxID=1126212 RepID=K2SWS2_MACPH|nr:hypothetical protein MPH_01689 [Macrophomina phaseolina MS6]
MALTWEPTELEMGAVVELMPWLGSPPLQKALVMICEPFASSVPTAVRVVDPPTYLGVADHDDLGVGAGLDVRLDLLGDGLGAGLDRCAVAVAARGRVVDGLGGGARVRVQDQVDDSAGGAEARRGGGLARAEDVDVGTGGTLGGVFHRGGEGGAGEEGKSGEGSMHGGCECENEWLSFGVAETNVWKDQPLMD